MIMNCFVKVFMVCLIFVVLGGCVLLFLVGGVLIDVIIFVVVIVNDIVIKIGIVFC